MVDIGIIDNLSTELQEQLPLLPANKQQFNLLSGRIRLVVNKILEQENVAENSLFQRHLEQLSNCLTECLAFMQKFTVSKYRLFWLRNDNYNSWFRGVRQCLLEVVQNLRLEVDYLRLFDVREDEESFNIDLQNNRALKEKTTTLLKSFLVHQLNIYELSSTLNVRKSLHVRKKFLCYDELSNDLQLQIAEYNWDQKNDLECCQLLQSLSINGYGFLNHEFKEALSEFTLIDRLVFIDEDKEHPSLDYCWSNYPELQLNWIKVMLSPKRAQHCFCWYRQLSKDLQDQLSTITKKDEGILQQEWDQSSENCYHLLQSLSQPLSLPSLQSSLSSSQSSQPTPSSNYSFLNEQFKQQLNDATKLHIQALKEINAHDDLSMEQYWHECPELHLSWLRSGYTARQPNLMFSSYGLSLSQPEEEHVSASQQEPTAKRAKLMPNVQKIIDDGSFSLLSVTIRANDECGTKFFIGLPQEEADRLLKIDRPINELDFDESAIINLFREDELVTEEELESIKHFFKEYFVTNSNVGALLKCLS